MDVITELACFLRKNRDLSIENSLRLIQCTLAPLLAFSGPVIILAFSGPVDGERVQKTHGSLCQMQQGGLADVTEHVHGTFHLSSRPRRLTYENAKGHHMLSRWGHLTRCCQFDDGTRQLAEITYKDALEKHGCLDMEDLQFEAEFSTWDQASQNSFSFACHLTVL